MYTVIPFLWKYDIPMPLLTVVISRNSHVLFVLQSPCDVFNLVRLLVESEHKVFERV